MVRPLEDSHHVRRFARHTFARLHDDWLSGSCDFPRLQRRLSTLYRVAAGCRCNLMGFAWR